MEKEITVANQIWWWEQKGETLILKSRLPGRKNRFSIRTRITYEVMTEEEARNTILMHLHEEK